MKKLILIFCVLCVSVVNSLSQNLEDLAGEVKFGSAEIKREALYQIRNLATAEASRIALPALQDPSEIVRATATHSIIFLPPDEAFQAVLPLLKDKAFFVRKEAAYALGKIKNPAAVKPLLDLLQTDKQIEVKAASAFALGEIGDIRAIAVLVSSLQKKPSEKLEFLRRCAARSIGQIVQVRQVNNNYVITPESFLPEKYDTFANLSYSAISETFPGYSSAIAVLVAILQNPKESDDVRREAAYSLGTFGDKSVVTFLQKNLSSKDYYLIEICKESLLKISSVERKN